jgi:hypothetical protein
MIEIPPMKEEIRMRNQEGKGLLQDQDAFLLHISGVFPKRLAGQTEEIPDIQTSGRLPSLTHSLHSHSTSPHATEILPSLGKHWMSVHQQKIYMSLIFFAVGFSAITALAAAIIGWLPLDIAGYLFVWPAVIIWLVVGILYPDYGKLALKGFVIGVLACLFYDCMRFTAIALGLWGDFIPRIGMWLLHTNEPDWLLGYIWRYVGDGGFMSVAFVVGYFLLKPKMDVRIAALLFGIAIWVCLVATILIAPLGTEMLFPLTPVTFSLSLLGHVIYGLSIGFLYPVFVPKNRDTWQISTSPSESLLAPKTAASARPSLLNLATSSTKEASRNQFMKPGLIDIYYK